MNKVKKKALGTYVAEETMERLDRAKRATGISKTVMVELGVKRELDYLEENYPGAYEKEKE